MNAKSIVLTVASFVALAWVAPLPAAAHVVRVNFVNDSTVCVNVSAVAWAVTQQAKFVGRRADVRPKDNATFTEDLIFTGSTSGGGTPPPVRKGVTVWTYGNTDCSGTSTGMYHAERVIDPNRPDPPFKFIGHPGAFRIE
ncbi:MAG TPA: hypothetical protein VKT72_08405 [Candidatus Baltobacteraceae bacterium]|nr:hypothetical protein [Candidatus Baltobacteraceae bacterium]